VPKGQYMLTLNNSQVFRHNLNGQKLWRDLMDKGKSLDTKRVEQPKATSLPSAGSSWTKKNEMQ